MPDHIRRAGAMDQNPIKQNPLAAAIDEATSVPMPISDEEKAQRAAVTAELHRLIAVTAAGGFVAMIVTEETDTIPRQMKTGLWGDSDTLRASAAQVVMLYSQRERAEPQSDLLLPPERELIVPGVQS